MSFEFVKTNNPAVSFPVQKEELSAWPVEMRKKAVATFDAEEAPQVEKLDLILAKRFFACGQFQDAERIFAKLCEIQPCFESYSGWADALSAQDKDKEALETYFKALDFTESVSETLFSVFKNIGNLSVKLGDFEQAEEYFNKAYTLKPDSDVLLVNYGTLEIQRGALEKAKNHFSEAIRRNSRNDKGWVGISLIHHAKSDPSLAWAAALKALDINPSNRTALGLVIQWGLEKGSESIVLDRICNYMEIQDQDGEMSLLLARLWTSKQEYQLASIEVERAYQLLEGSAEAHQLRFQLRKVLRESR